VLPNNIHGFRPNRGTESALIELLEKIKYYKSRNKKVALLALDASAAFDVLDIGLVLKSLEAINQSINIFRSQYNLQYTV